VAIGSRSGVTVLDASALLALINNEQVSDVVAAFIVDYSSVLPNWLKSFGKLRLLR
jgi:PIN domain nuclease of toxin-antitoxin system